MSGEQLITGVAHLGVRVHDLDRSREFYELLGFKLVLGPVGPEPIAILEHPGGVEINLVLNATESDVPNLLMDVEEKHAGYTHVALMITDMDAALALLQRAGISVSGGPNEYPGGARGVFVRDPDRNVVELYQPASS